MQQVSQDNYAFLNKEVHVSNIMSESDSLSISDMSIKDVVTRPFVVLRSQRFLVRVRLLLMCRGKLSAVVARLMSLSVCEACGKGSEEVKRCPPLSLAVL